jgi:sulfur-carrier protein adenylyltransferase/sulfurtransferase
MWFLKNPARYQAEVDAIASLHEMSPWLTALNWRFDGGRLLCDAELIVAGKLYPVTLRYNTGFPNTPPSVRPRVEERWSMHQYGKGGELCLEYGPDNWVPTLTGADMLQSAYKLLATEAIPDDSGVPSAVASRHASTLGQRLRSEPGRFLETTALQEQLVQIKEITPAKFRIRTVGSQWAAYVAEMTDSAGGSWTDPTIPTALSELGNEIRGYIVPISHEISEAAIQSGKALRQFLLGNSHEAEQMPDIGMLLAVTPAGPRAFFLGSASDYAFEFVMLAPDGIQRVYPEYAALADKKVGLIGCGSVGSKTAVMLARAGVRKLVLVDDDVMLADNLIRNELDWTGVGIHKARALAQRLRLIHPQVEVEEKFQRFGGQESGAALDGTVKALAKCDVVIDATADAWTFNLAAAIATDGGKPMLWAEVYAGGIAGLVARSRPGIEPSPQYARDRVLKWYAQQNAPVPESSGNRYENNGEAGPQIADDADVTVIAAHLARLTTDTLLARSPSYFPYSAYVIGLREGWMIQQAFDTAPIDLGPPEAATPTAGSDDPQWKAGIAGILELLEQSDAPT